MRHRPRHVRVVGDKARRRLLPAATRNRCTGNRAARGRRRDAIRARQRTIMGMKRLFLALLSATILMTLTLGVGRAAAPACDPDNGGLKLPQGFCAAVVAENVGRARHLLVAPNGDVFVSTQ